MKSIPTSQGFSALVDDEDFVFLARFKWYANVQKAPGKVYAATDVGRRRIYMHQLLIPRARMVDHRNRNGLDNQKHNLRECSKAENAVNAKLNSNSSSGVKGASWHKAAGKWMAHAGFNGRQVYLGLHATKEEAGNAYTEFMKSKFGDFVETSACTQNQ